ncbi:hypothetical protein T484DRAFT_1918455 [Baffinella frigidus]|nr:hypothetical protein T484DRAFT_1918455 [Cryptophyta sp. CCMP2293]
MEFDGMARLQVNRTQRHLGALQREGISAARRHPSASRHRKGGGSSPTGGDDLVYEPSTELRQLSREYPMMGGADEYLRSEYSRENVHHHGRGVRPSGVSRERSKNDLQHERSWSAPPVRLVAPKCVSRDVSREMKQQRASLAAHALQELEEQSEENPLRRRGIAQLYEWLKTVSLQEHLPALLELGVEDVSHLGDLEVEDLEEAGLARPERKRFLRKQALLSLALPRPRSGLFIQSAFSNPQNAQDAQNALVNDTAELTFSARSNLSTGTSDESFGVDPPSTARTASSDCSPARDAHAGSTHTWRPASSEEHSRDSTRSGGSRDTMGKRATTSAFRDSEGVAHLAGGAGAGAAGAGGKGGGVVSPGGGDGGEGGGGGGGRGVSPDAGAGEKPLKPSPASHARGA